MTELQTDREGQALITSFPGLNLADEEEMFWKFQLSSHIADSGAVSTLSQYRPTFEPQLRMVLLPVDTSTDVKPESLEKSGFIDDHTFGKCHKECTAIEHFVALEEYASHAGFRNEPLVLEHPHSHIASPSCHSLLIGIVAAVYHLH